LFLKDIIISDISYTAALDFEKNYKSITKRTNFGLSLAVEGELIYKRNNENILLDREHIVYLPGKSEYSVKCVKKGRFIVINFDVENDEICPDTFMRFKTKSTQILHREQKVMEKLIHSELPQKRVLLLSSFYKIVSLIIADNASSNVVPVLRKGLLYIENNLENNRLTNTQIANHLGISEVYLRKLFKNNLNISTKQYIQNLRLEKAKNLLVTTKYSVTEISELCGYSGVYHFCRIFKEKTGYTPMEYRLKNTISIF